jgi:hypothetical protein
MPRTEGCACLAECSRIDSAYIEVNKAGPTAVDEGQYNQNEEEQRSEEKVLQNA